MSSMLEQAIVDAKALKEAAYKSAEDALVERYSPELKEAVYSMLEQEDDAGEIDALMGGGIAPPDQGEGEVAGMDIPLAATDGENLCACPDEEEEVEIDFDELERQMMADEEPEVEAGGEDIGMPDELDITIDDEDSVDLQESELEELLGSDYPREEYESPIDPGMEMHDRRTNKLSLFGEDDMEDDELGFGLEDEFEDDDLDLDMTLMGVDDYDTEDEMGMPLGMGWDDEESGMMDPYGDLEDDEELYEFDSWLEEAVEEAVKLSPEYMKKKKEKERKKKQDQVKKDTNSMNLSEGKRDSSDKKVLLENKELVKMNNALNEQLQKAISINETHTASIEKLEKDNEAVKSKLVEVATVLNEVNLQNAKLLYTNKVLESDSLNERQKNKIVEAISKTGNVEETKVVYETLIGSVGSDGESRKKSKSLNETVARKQTLMIQRRKPEANKNPLKDRWQKVAGIVK